MPIRGSSFNNTSNGGAGALNLNNPRSNVNNNVSFRSASPHFCQQSCSQVGTSSAYGLKGFISIPKAASREPEKKPASKCGLFCGYYGSADDYIKQPEEKEVTDSGSNADA